MITRVLSILQGPLCHSNPKETNGAVQLEIYDETPIQWSCNSPQRTWHDLGLQPRMDKAFCPLAEPGTGLKTQQSTFVTKEKISK